MFTQYGSQSKTEISKKKKYFSLVDLMSIAEVSEEAKITIAKGSEWL